MKTLVLTNHSPTIFRFKKLNASSDRNFIFMITSDSYLITYKASSQGNFQNGLRYTNTILIPYLNDILHFPNQILLLCGNGLFLLTDKITTLISKREFITAKVSDQKVYLTEKVDDLYVLHQLVIRSVKDSNTKVDKHFGNSATRDENVYEEIIFSPLNIELIETHRSKKNIFIEHVNAHQIILSDHLLLGENRFEWTEGSVLSFRLIDKNDEEINCKKDIHKEETKEDDFILKNPSSGTVLDSILNQSVLKKSIYGTIMTSRTLFLMNLVTGNIISKLEMSNGNLVDHVVLSDKIIVSDIAGRIFWINLMNMNNLDVYQKLHLHDGPVRLLKLGQSHILTVTNHIYHIYFSNGDQNIEQGKINYPQQYKQANQTETNSHVLVQEKISAPEILRNSEMEKDLKKNYRTPWEHSVHDIARNDEVSKINNETKSKDLTRPVDTISCDNIKKSNQDPNKFNNENPEPVRDWHFQYFSDVDMVRKSQDILLIFSNKSINFYTIRQSLDDIGNVDVRSEESNPEYEKNLGIEYLFKLSLSGIVLQSFIQESFFTCQIGNICKLFSFHLANKFECMKIKEWPCLLHILFNHNGVIYLQYLQTNGSIFRYNVNTGEEEKIDQKMNPLHFTEFINKEKTPSEYNVDSPLAHLQIQTEKKDTCVNYLTIHHCFTIKKLRNKQVLKIFFLKDPIRSSLILMTEDKLYQIRDLPQSDEKNEIHHTEREDIVDNMDNLKDHIETEQRKNGDSSENETRESKPGPNNLQESRDIKPSETVPSFTSSQATLGHYLVALEHFKGYLIVIKNEKDEIVGKWGRK